MYSGISIGPLFYYMYNRYLGCITHAARLSHSLLTDLLHTGKIATHGVISRNIKFYTTKFINRLTCNLFRYNMVNAIRA